MKVVATNQIKNEYLDPARYMDRHEYNKRRRKIIKRSQIAIAVGLLILIFAPILYGNGYLQWSGNSGRRTASQANFGLLLIAIGLPLYGLYQWMTINKQIKKVRRVELLWLYPDLKSEEKLITNEKESPIPKIVIAAILSALLLTGLYFWVISIFQ